MKRTREKTLKLFELYNSLSDNQRSQFWGAAINVFLIIFTFWLGLTVQLVVVDTNKSYNEELIKMQYQKKLTEDRHKLNIAKSSRFEGGLVAKWNSGEVDVLLDYDKFKENVIAYYAIEDSILKICEDLRWHIKSKVRLKQFDDSLKECLNDLSRNLVFLKGENELEIMDEYSNFLRSDGFKKRYGGLSVEDADTLRKSLRPAAMRFLSLSQVEKEAAVVNLMTDYSRTSRFLVDLIEHEMEEYNDCGFINKLSDSSPFFKSLILLIVCLGMSIPISALILHKIHIPSTDRGYTKEEGSMILKERDEWKSRAKELDCLVLLQNDKIKILEQKYDDLRDDYMDVLAELGERNSLDKSPN